MAESLGYRTTDPWRGRSEPSAVSPPHTSVVSVFLLHPSLQVPLVGLVAALGWTVGLLYGRWLYIPDLSRRGPFIFHHAFASLPRVPP